MAPTKKDPPVNAASASGSNDKEAKLNPEQSAALILDYLRKQNRPYSAIDVSANLKNRVTKTATAKLLKDLHERGDLEGRAAGKQIVYHAVQSQADVTSIEELQALDAQTFDLKEETITLKNEEKSLRAELREDSARVPISQLKASISALQQESAGLQERLDKLRHGQSGQEAMLSPADREKVHADHSRWTRVAAVRRKIRGELWAEIADTVGKEQAKTVREELGLEF